MVSSSTTSESPKKSNMTLSNRVSWPPLIVTVTLTRSSPFTLTPPTLSAPVGPLVTTGGWAGALVIRLPLTTTGRRFNISRAPAPTCKSPCTVNGPTRVTFALTPIRTLGKVPLACAFDPVSVTNPLPMIVLPANPSPVTVNVKPFVFTVAPGSTVMLWTVTFCVSAGMTGSPAATYTLSVATGTPFGLQFFGFDQFVVDAVP